jgi:hypothetical protein
MLTSRDQEILKTLALKVRMFSLDQIAQTWWNASATGKANARRRLATLVSAKLLRLSHVQARPLPELTSPVIVWKPGQATPHFGAVAWKLQSRWRNPPQKTSVYVATQKAANQYGGRLRGIIRHDLQATHDLGVAQVYLHKLSSNRKAAELWLGEDVLGLTRLYGPKSRRTAHGHCLVRRRGNIPDAVITSAFQQSKLRLVIEFGGAYDARRVQRFHDHCAAQNLPYELW